MQYQHSVVRHRPDMTLSHDMAVSAALAEFANTGWRLVNASVVTVNTEGGQSTSVETHLFWEKGS